MLPWAPRGLVVFDEAKRVAMDLPATPNLGRLPPQPPPGLWGTWRADPATAGLFDDDVGDPDRVRVLVHGELAGVRVRGCDAKVCWGVLTEDHPPSRSGDSMEFPHAMLAQLAPGALPVATPRAGSRGR